MNVQVWLPRDGRFAGYDRPREVLCTRDIDTVVPMLERAERAARAGALVVGFLGYEAASAFDSALKTRPPAQLPLAWFAVFDREPELLEPAHGCLPAAPALAWEPTLAAADYQAGVAEIRRYLRQGDTYQVNYTFRLRAPFTADPRDLFLRLYESQPTPLGMYIETDEFALCSASPELFFERDGEHVTTRPMKGTRTRAPSWAEDRQQREALAASAKDRAENVMIVDMIRNDLGRVARPDSVRVSAAYAVETHPTVHQMTSTVEARTAVPHAALFAALFPCASVTGAPKVRTMEIIRELETTPRGIYTGCMGWLQGERACFNVAIRTAVVDRRAGTVEYGVGSGIVWDSDTGAEYEECLAKAAVLTHTTADFSLLETMRWEPPERRGDPVLGGAGQSGIVLLERHLERLRRSAEYFRIPVDLTAVRGLLSAVDGADPLRVRLLVDRDGSPRVETAALRERATPLRVRFARDPVNRTDVFLYHKTTRRGTYEQALATYSDMDDVLLWNECGEVTESTMANVIVERGGQRLTPPVSCGLLAGTLRAELIETGAVRECVLTLDEVRMAERIWLVNSVRGWMEARLVPGDPCFESGSVG